MYIRTKDGVYEVIQYNDIYTEVKGNADGVPINDGNTAIHYSNILKQSENLEELCDEFVDGEQHYIIQNKNIVKDIPNKPALKNHTIYGAIWTSKGLIYVAKMNDKGELCLL